MGVGEECHVPPELFCLISYTIKKEIGLYVSEVTTTQMFIKYRALFS